MHAADVRSFLDRRWDLVDAEKLRTRAERYQREGPAACARAAQALRDDAAKLGAHADRAADLRHHIRWRIVLDRIEADVARAR